jgi:hypothetical protein
MERLFVAGTSVFTIRENAGLAKEMLAVTITRDDQVEWTYQMASWRPLAVGHGRGSAYLWTARDLVILPGDPGEDPVALSVDEDLLVVFRTAAGWVLVCETSARLADLQGEISRIELADTAERVWWAAGALQIEDASGMTAAINVTGGRLALATPGQP